METVKRKGQSFSSDDILKGRERLGVKSGETLILFASEAISEVYGDDGKQFGFTQKSVFNHFVNSLERSGFAERVVVAIRRHPKESESRFEEFISNYSGDLRFTLDTESDPHLAVISSDLVAGMMSMLLVEAVVLGKSTMSVQIGLSGENPFILDKLGVLKTVLTESELQKRVAAFLRGDSRERGVMEVEDSAVDNIIDSMEALL